MNYLGKGIYSVSDVRRLTGLPTQSIKRWLSGHDYVYKGEKRHTRELWEPDYEPIEDTLGLSFVDLIEVNFVKAFRELGLSLKTIREALIQAQKRFGIDHAFCSKKFLTDGRKIFLEIKDYTGQKILEIYLSGNMSLRMLCHHS